MMRRPVPPLTRCESTIAREVRYWRRAFRGQLGSDDLSQEAWIIALRVLRAFDPSRDVKIETYLTRALRNHFARLVKVTLTRAFLYRAEQREQVARNYYGLELSGSHRIDPRRAVHLVNQLRALPRTQQQLARDLFDTGGALARVARLRGWSLHMTRQRVIALRTKLDRGKR